MRDFSELNINEGGQPVGRPAPTSDDIEEFQSHFGIRLPDEYLSLLRYSNGGHPELDTFTPAGGPISQCAVNQFYHLNHDKTSFACLWQATTEWRPILGNDEFPFAADGGDNQFILDLKTRPPSVKVCVHDDNFLIVDLAPSFETFITALAINPDDT